MSRKWYVVHVYSGFESKVKISLEDRIRNSPHPEKFGEVLVPTEQVVELVKGKKKESSRKFYPGYILVNLHLDDETWHIVTNTAKVTGFLGGGNRPTPITEEEALHNSTRPNDLRLKIDYYVAQKQKELRMMQGDYVEDEEEVDKDIMALKSYKK